MSGLEPERIIRLEVDRVVLLDQRQLPDEEVELTCRSAAEVAEAIRTLAVRGAPAIGIAAAYGYALAAKRGEDLDEAFALLESTRPTAANLGWALREVRAASDPAGRARDLHAEEVERCRQMSVHAAALLEPGSRALTHCNTGALATGGQGTALGALREAWARGLVSHVFVDETRPLLQGARLTAWELETGGIPHTVVADAAAGHLLATGQVDCVLVGADRIAANGDTANKIGTYGVAVDVRANLVYVTNRDDSNVSVINPVDFKEIVRLPVGLSPEGLGVDSNRGVVYIGNSGDGSLSLIDAVKLNVFATLVVGQTPKAAVVDPSTGRVYVPSQLDNVVRVIQP